MLFQTTLKFMGSGENVSPGVHWLGAEHVTVDVCSLQMHEL